MTLQDFLSHYQYKPDPVKKDIWIIPNKVNNQYLDDCDGFCLGVLFYVLSNSSLLKFWYLLLFTDTRIYYVVTNNNIGHVILRHKGLYIDTYSKAWVIKEQVLDYGHKFHWSKMFFFWQVALKMLIGKILIKMK